MKEAAPQTVFLKDYKPSDFLVERIDLDIELYEDRAEVTSVIGVCRNQAVAEGVNALRLDGEGLELHSVALDGRPLEVGEYALDERGLTVFDVPERFALRTVSVIHPERNGALEGLYKSSGNFCTQCEAEGFRKITFYLDRPDVMAVFTTRIAAEKARYPVLLSNGNLIAAGEGHGGRHWAQWHDPFPKPAYLFALVAGDLALTEDRFVTRSGREVALRIYTEAHNADRTGHAMRSLKKAMRWDEDRFGLEYDLDVFMIVAVDDFNMGAMENKGLNIFNSKLLLARPDTATDADYEAIEAVVAHEYFHNWTGNRVTCRDWFQLSLKEGLTVFRDQEFTADVTSRGVKRIDDVRKLRTYQFAEDASPMAHPVRPPAYIEINNFYTLTVYDKGAEVVRMYQTLLGREGFRKGMDLYFARHDGQAVTTDDFRAAMADANGADLGQFQRWYDQAGTPEVTVTDSWDPEQGRYALRVQQSCPPTPESDHKAPFLIPMVVGLLDSRGNPLPLRLAGESGEAQFESVIPIREAEQTLVFVDLPERPLPSLFRQFSAPIKLRFDYTDEQLAFLAARDPDSFNRWEAGQQLATRVLLDLISRHGRGEFLPLDQHLAQVYRSLLSTPAEDAALLAEALVLPDEGFLADQLASVDVDAVHAAREHLRQALAQELLPLWQEVYAQQRIDHEYRYVAPDCGKRRLRNVALAYLVAAGDEGGRRLALHQFDSAGNMTEVIGALRALSTVDCEERNSAMQRFHDRWFDDPLVLDKWFALVAGSPLPGTLEKVRSLLDHPRFNLRNPNRVRALLGAFAQNLVCFHAADGAGYRFLADQIITLDRFNPQMAARLAKSFTRWRRFDTHRQTSMRAEVERIHGTEGLSRDTFEVIDRCLR